MKFQKILLKLIILSVFLTVSVYAEDWDFGKGVDYYTQSKRIPGLRFCRRQVIEKETGDYVFYERRVQKYRQIGNSNPCEGINFSSSDEISRISEAELKAEVEKQIPSGLTDIEFTEKVFELSSDLANAGMPDGEKIIASNLSLKNRDALPALEKVQMFAAGVVLVYAGAAALSAVTNAARSSGGIINGIASRLSSWGQTVRTWFGGQPVPVSDFAYAAQAGAESAGSAIIQNAGSYVEKSLKDFLADLTLIVNPLKSGGNLPEVTTSAIAGLSSIPSSYTYGNSSASAVTSVASSSSAADNLPDNELAEIAELPGHLFNRAVGDSIAGRKDIDSLVKLADILLKKLVGLKNTGQSGSNDYRQTLKKIISLQNLADRWNRETETGNNRELSALLDKIETVIANNTGPTLYPPVPTPMGVTSTRDDGVVDIDITSMGSTIFKLKYGNHIYDLCKIIKLFRVQYTV